MNQVKELFVEQLINVADIKIPDNRMRKDFGDIDELAMDISLNGLFNPITVNNDLTLIAGERRYHAVRRLGNETVRASVPVRQLTPTECLVVEHAENDKRKGFTWQECCAAEDEFYNHMKKLDPKITLTEVAKTLNISKGVLSTSRNIIKAAKKHPEVLKQQSKKRAYAMVSRVIETALIAERLARKTKDFETKREEQQNNATPDEVIKTAESLEDKLNRIQERVSNSVRHGDVLKNIDNIEDGSINLMLCDPPWGVDIEKTSGMHHTKTFDDSKKYAFQFLDDLLGAIYPKMATDSVIILFFPLALDWFIFVDNVVRKHNYTRAELPMFWFKDATSAANSNPHGMPGVIYEPMYFIRKGMPYIVKPTVNVYTAKIPFQRVHPTQKPTILYKQLIMDYSSPGDTIFDPTYGSGASLAAAEHMGDRHYLGYDDSEICFVHGMDNVIKHALLRENEQMLLDEAMQSEDEPSEQEANDANL